MFEIQYVVKNAEGKICLKTVFKENALKHASQPGYKLLKVPMSR